MAIFLKEAGPWMLKKSNILPEFLTHVAMNQSNHSIRRCTRCILPSSIGSVHFDEAGVCNYCREYEKDFRHWEALEEKRKAEFSSILRKARKLKRPYDCLVPLSGGKDSTYTLYVATKRYGLKTLAVTFDNGYLTKLARENIQNALASSHADHIYYSMNKERSSELFGVFARQTGDFCNACMRGINYSIEMTCKAFHIPLVIKGSGRRVQYVSQIKGVTTVNTPSYFANVIKGTGAEQAFSHFSRNRYHLEIQKIMGGLCDILKIKRTWLMRWLPQHIGIYDYIYKPFPELIEIIKKEMKWNDGSGAAEHLDCELHDVPFYNNTLRITGITGHTFYYSGLIRQGLISREEALSREEAELKNQRVPRELKDFLRSQGIDFQSYKSTVQNADRSMYEPKIQRFARDVYHRFRKF